MDKLDDQWLRQLSAKSDFGELLLAASGVELAEDLASRVLERKSRYEGEKLWTVEKRRDDKRKATIEHYTEILVDGPRLVFPLAKMNMSFNPNELIPLGKHGTVYPTLAITDNWGILTATNGALISSDFRSVIVSIPAGFSGSTELNGCKIDLQDGWSIEKISENHFAIRQNGKIK